MADQREEGDLQDLYTMTDTLTHFLGDPGLVLRHKEDLVDERCNFKTGKGIGV